MADQEKFTAEVFQELESGNKFQAVQTILDQYHLLDPKEFKTAIDAMCKASKVAPVTDVYTQEKNGEVTAIYLDDSYFYDTPLFKKSKFDGTPLPDPKLERLAQVFSLTNSVVGAPDHVISASRADWKSAARYLLNESLKLSPEDRFQVLTRAEEIDDMPSWGNGLSIVFTDLDWDGNRTELAEFSLIEKAHHYNGLTSRESSTLYLQGPKQKKVD